MKIQKREKVADNSLSTTLLLNAFQNLLAILVKLFF